MANNHVTFTASLVRRTPKAALLNVDGMNLWFRAQYLKTNADGSYSTTQKQYDNALADARQFAQAKKERETGTVAIPGGSWGECRNGSYYLKTRAEVFAVDMDVRGPLTFVKPADAHVEGGTLIVNYGAYLNALDRAENDFHRDRHTECRCYISGAEIELDAE